MLWPLHRGKLDERGAVQEKWPAEQATLNTVIRTVPFHEASDADIQGGVRGEADIALEICHVGAGGKDIAGLHGHVLADGFLSKMFFYQADEGVEFDGGMVADVVDAVGCAGRPRIGVRGIPIGIGFRNPVGSPHDSLHDVVDVGEVALHASLVEHLYWLSFQNRLREQEIRHVRPAPRPVHREEPQTRRRQSVQVRIRVGHQLVRLLGGGIEGDGMVHVVVHGKRLRSVQPVDGTAGGVCQVRGPGMAATFEEVGEPHQIALHVRVRVRDGVAHTGLRRQIHHPVEGMRCEQRLQGRSILKRTPYESEIPGQGPELFQPCLLEGNVIVVVEVVETHHRITTTQQGFA